MGWIVGGCPSDIGRRSPYQIPVFQYEALRSGHGILSQQDTFDVVRDAGGGQTEVAAIDPVASMESIDNPALKQAAAQIKAKLERVMAQL